MTSPRKARADSIASAVEAAQAATLPDIEPPAHVRLRDTDRPFWTAIVRARARDEWDEVALATAAQLARCQADIEATQAAIDRDGVLTSAAAGTPKLHPRVTVLDLLVKRAMSLTRLLQLQPSASRALEDRTKQRAAERQAREVRDQVAAEGGEGLLA